MSEAGRRLLAGAAEALAFAKGEEPAARIHINGHAYVPESNLAAAREWVRELHALLSEADRRLPWESYGFGNDFADRVEAAIAKAPPHET